MGKNCARAGMRKLGSPASLQNLVLHLFSAPGAPQLSVRTKMHPRAEMLADVGLAIAVDHLFRC